jgi:hypothetical protein
MGLISLEKRNNVILDSNSPSVNIWVVDVCTIRGIVYTNGGAERFVKDLAITIIGDGDELFVKDSPAITIIGDEAGCPSRHNYYRWWG